MVEVVGEPDGDAPRRGADDRVADSLGDRAVELDVVDRDVEARRRRGAEPAQLVGDLGGILAAVRQRAELDQALLAFNDAL
jgi:hypothetical protein